MEVQITERKLSWSHYSHLMLHHSDTVISVTKVTQARNDVAITQVVSFSVTRGGGSEKGGTYLFSSKP